MKKKFAILAATLVLGFLAEVAAQDAPEKGVLRLPNFLASHMVLQRNKPIVIQGWGKVGAKIKVSLGNENVATSVEKTGRWELSLKARKANTKPVDLKVESGTQTITLTDILIGDVWLGSGQSNMQAGLGGDDVKAAKHPQIRLFNVSTSRDSLAKLSLKARKANAPTEDLDGTWKVCSPETAGGFSAVLFHFGARLQKEVSIPIGLINSSRGASAIEPWTTYPNRSNHLYLAVIAPLRKQGIAGCIWFQGETNVMFKNGLTYFGKMKDLIEGWRGNWGQDMPFYYVHLTPCTAEGYAPGELPKVWEAQTKALTLPHTGMAVITDLAGDLGMHPRDKHGIGNRLARWALAKTYDKDIAFSGPLFKGIEIRGNKARLSFAHAKGLKSSDGKALTEFKIVTTEGKLVPAQAKIDGDIVVVSSKDVIPVAVQFGWHKTAQPNLVNGAGLPAAPFHSDNWQGGTGE
ncbi:MAG TPA: sialate O-acetylesterase [Planctomycetes bacterium]|nr:sialate O-acetylesterase [Planctomycetota bacterium]